MSNTPTCPFFSENLDFSLVFVKFFLNFWWRQTVDVASKQRSKSGDFSSKFANQLHVRVFIDLRFVDDVLGATRVPKRRQCLGVVALSGTDCWIRKEEKKRKAQNNLM